MHIERNMTRSERTTISASMSGAPSLVNSLQSLTSGSKLSFAQASLKSTDEPERSFIEEFLAKAKFYTSLCLGKYHLCSHKTEIISIFNKSFHGTFFYQIKKYRNVCHIVCVCLPISYTICCGSGNYNNCS